VPVNHRPRMRGTTKYGIRNRMWVGLYDLFGVMWLRKRALHYQIRDKSS
jgi:dolichol-phosphate mannosyltransferase